MARFSKNIFNFLISIQEAKKWSSGQRDWLGNKRFEFDAYTNAIIYDAYSSTIKKKKETRTYKFICDLKLFLSGKKLTALV